MTHTIILRTVCGCERMLAIPNRELPPVYRVPFQRTKFSHIWSEQDAFPLPNFSTREFERTGERGKYGYPVYLEVAK